MTLDGSSIPKLVRHRHVSHSGQISDPEPRTRISSKEKPEEIRPETDHQNQDSHTQWLQSYKSYQEIKLECIDSMRNQLKRTLEKEEEFRINVQRYKENSK